MLCIAQTTLNFHWIRKAQFGEKRSGPQIELHMKIIQILYKIGTNDQENTINTKLILYDPSYFSLHTVSTEKPGRITGYYYRKQL